MTWLWSFVAAALAAVVAGAGAFALGLGVVQWYAVSSAEGKSAYMVVYGALAGVVGGALLGLVAARVAVWVWSGDAGPQIVAAVGVPVVVLGVAAAVAWWQSDRPPTMGGRPLELLVEVQLPAGSAWPVTGEIELGSVRGGVMRSQESGVVVLADAREEDGRWIVPARLPLYTSRGTPVMSVTIDGRREVFGLPLAGRRLHVAHAAWSPWLPQPRPDGGPALYPSRYRFRVVVEPVAGHSATTPLGECDTPWLG